MPCPWPVFDKRVPLDSLEHALRHSRPVTPILLALDCLDPHERRRLIAGACYRAQLAVSRSSRMISRVVIGILVAWDEDREEAEAEEEHARIEGSRTTAELERDARREP